MKTVPQWLKRLQSIFLGKKFLDVVDETSEESFPASDPPAWAGFKYKDQLVDSRATQDPFFLLKEEHQLIMKMMYAIHEQIENLQQNKPLDTKSIKAIIEFMYCFVDKCHYRKEKNYLFPALEHSKAPLAECHLDNFMHDHELGQTLVATLEKNLQRYAQNDPTARSALLDTLEQLKEVYTQHTLREENVIFPLAEKYLSKDIQKSLFAQFEKINAEVGIK